MNKTLAFVDSLLKPGHPLMVVGPRGCGKFYAVQSVLKDRGIITNCLSPSLLNDMKTREQLHDYETKRMFFEYTLADFTKKYIKNCAGNVALYFDELNKLDPSESAPFLMMLLEQMLYNADRYIIIGGLKPLESPMLERCQVIEFSKWEPA